MNEYYSRNFSRLEAETDREIAETRSLDRDVFLLQNELDRVKNSVANKYIKWSLAKDRFISEVTAYSLDIISKMNTGELSPMKPSTLWNKKSLRSKGKIKCLPWSK